MGNMGNQRCALLSCLLISLCASTHAQGARSLLSNAARSLYIDANALPTGTTGWNVLINVTCPGAYTTVSAISLISGMKALGFKTDSSALAFQGRDALPNYQYQASYAMNLPDAATGQDVLTTMAPLTAAGLTAAAGIQVSMVSISAAPLSVTYYPAVTTNEVIPVPSSPPPPLLKLTSPSPSPLAVDLPPTTLPSPTIPLPKVPLPVVKPWMFNSSECTSSGSVFNSTTVFNITQVNSTTARVTTIVNATFYDLMRYNPSLFNLTTIFNKTMLASTLFNSSLLSSLFNRTNYRPSTPFNGTLFNSSSFNETLCTFNYVNTIHGLKAPPDSMPAAPPPFMRRRLITHFRK